MSCFGVEVVDHVGRTTGRRSRRPSWKPERVVSGAAGQPRRSQRRRRPADRARPPTRTSLPSSPEPVAAGAAVDRSSPWPPVSWSSPPRPRSWLSRSSAAAKSRAIRTSLRAVVAAAAGRVVADDQHRAVVERGVAGGGGAQRAVEVDRGVAGREAHRAADARSTVICGGGDVADVERLAVVDQCPGGDGRRSWRRRRASRRWCRRRRSSRPSRRRCRSPGCTRCRSRCRACRRRGRSPSGRRPGSCTEPEAVGVAAADCRLKSVICCVHRRATAACGRRAAPS